MASLFGHLVLYQRVLIRWEIMPFFDRQRWRVATLIIALLGSVAYLVISVFLRGNTFLQSPLALMMISAAVSCSVLVLFILASMARVAAAQEKHAKALVTLLCLFDLTV